MIIRFDMKIATASLLLVVLLAISNALPGPTQSAPRYPNELKAFRLFDEGNWKALQPYVSTASDVRKWLGEPSPVSIPYGADWYVIVFYFGSSTINGKPWGNSLKGTIDSIIFYPQRRISFHHIILPKPFKCDAVWSSHQVATQIKCSDGSGLSYVIYKNNSPDNTVQADDLAYIEYGASDADLKKLQAAE
jgi:hypothetical protein